jgi:Fe2+ transport system protein B
LTVIILALAALVVYFFSKNKQKDAEIAEVIEMMTFEKEQVEREFQDAAAQFDGYNSGNIRNDSLFKLLDDQKHKIQQLLEELRITKSTNARRIAELRAELKTVRSVMVHYVNQIDSLNAENKVLKTENKEVKKRYEKAAQVVEQLSKEKENLAEVITRAAKLEIIDFEVKKLNSRNKKTSLLSQLATLQFDFTITKNITASPGQKTVYLRLTRPDGETLAKNPDAMFGFEDKQIAYSAKKEIEYAGEQMSDVIYWAVEEIVQKGNYTADFFIDGYRVGTFTFVIKK